VAETAKEAVTSVTAKGAALVGRDPVCGKTVRRPAKRLQFVYAEETYYFHSEECRNRFAEQPEVFLSHPGEEGDKARFDRAIRPEEYQHRGELKLGTPATLEQPRVESGSG
jgi:YHS domain-containing protein